MKKFVALLISIFYCCTNACFAMSELYYLKNIKTANIQPYVENSYTEHGFNIVKQNPYYGVSQNGNDKAIVILQQSGDNMFYYYQSDNNTKINKSILKEIKRQNIVCEQSFNTNIISIYDNLAQDLIKSAGIVKQYSFDEPEDVFTPPAQTQYQQPSVYKGSVGQVAAGTKINAYLQNAINTATAAKGDRVTAVLQQNLTYNGVTVAPQGSVLYGTLTTARNASYGSRNGRVVISFDQLVTPDNQVYNVSTEKIDFTVSNDGKWSNSVKSAVGSAAAGAVVGLLFALLSNSDHVGRSAAIGAGVGAGSSLIFSTAEKGVDAEIPSFTEIEVTLTSPLNVSVSY